MSRIAEIAAPESDRLEREIGNADVASFDAASMFRARIQAMTARMAFIAPTRRRREGRVALTDAGESG